jgi:hypothetical protein
MLPSPGKVDLTKRALDDDSVVCQPLNLLRANRAKQNESHTLHDFVTNAPSLA